jgi:hypothetical protein
VRVQLRRRLALGALRAACCLAALIGAGQQARAQSSASAGSSVVYEPGSAVNMLVVVPEVDAEVELADALAVRATWTADVVSGASVAVVDQPAETLDAISSASVTDTRHVLGGALTLRDGQSTLAAGYRYGFERDYRSHGLDLTARTELADRNTGFELAYARSFDSVCDGPDASDPVLKPRMPDSDGCFGGDEREARELAVHGLQAGVTQNLTSWLVLQGTLSAQLLDGFQSNPYRAVRIGRTAAQEHHPDDRARYALGVGARIWIEPLSGAVQPELRVYRDTWGVRSLTADLGYEQRLVAGLRMRAHARYYLQSGADFYSDDYVLTPRGQYFTGDRELSRMRSLMLGGAFRWSPAPGDDGRVIGFLDRFTLALEADVLSSTFPDFHYDRIAVPNDLALLGTLAIELVF